MARTLILSCSAIWFVAATFIIAQQWSGERFSGDGYLYYLVTNFEPAGWSQRHPECRIRFGRWPDGTPIDESLLNNKYGSIIREMNGYVDSAERERDRQLGNAQREVASCEQAQWLPIARENAVNQQRLELIALAILPPLLLFVVVAVLGWIWKRLLRSLWLTMPSHVRRGLLRLYAVISVSWIGWFGYQIASHGPHWRYLSQTFWTMLAVPIGSPLLLFVILWVRNGFRKPPLTLDEESNIVAKPPPIRRSKSNLAISQQQAPEVSEYKLETDKNPSTTLLVISMLLFPRIWVIDVTSVSLYWIARLPSFLRSF